MKTRTQKLISLVLVLMMLVSMVPMGIFTINAADANVVSIGTVADWNNYAGTTDFAGKTVKLTADIDFENATSVKPLANTFAGTFDGQGHTIKNATFTATGDAAVIAIETLDGASFANVNFSNITLTSTGGGDTRVGLLTAKMSSLEDVVIEKINATGITVTNAGTGAAGGLIGHWYLGEAKNPGNGCKATLRKVNFTGTITSATSNKTGNINYATGIGGLIGSVAAHHTGGTDICELHIENIKVDVTITGTTDADYTIGHAGVVGSFATTSNAHKSFFDTCYVKTTINRVNAGAVSALLGYTFSGYHEYEYCILDITIGSGGKYYPTLLGTFRNNCEVKATNLFTTNTTLNHMQPISGGEIINGVKMTNALKVATVISAAEANAMCVYDSEGYIRPLSDLEKGLANYSTTTTFTINSIEDWNTIAAWATANHPTNNWVGKTIKLNADLIGAVDAQGNPTTVLPTLSPTRFNGTFDGNGKTIKNVNVAGQLITNTGDSCTIKNITLDNVKATKTSYAALFFGTAANWGTITFSGVTVQNCAVMGQGASRAGVLFGINTQNKNTKVVISNVVIRDTSLVGEDHVGALFGSNQTGAAGSSVEINGVTMERVSLTFSDANTEGTIGGLIGWMTGSVNDNNGLSIKNITMTDVSIEAPNTYATGGLIGRMEQYLSMTLENVVADVDITTTTPTLKSGRQAGGLFGTVHTVAGHTTTIKNVSVNGSLDAGQLSYKGGLIGRTTGVGAVVIENVKSTMDVTASYSGDNLGKLDYDVAGGAIGYIANGATITFNNVYVGGTVTTPGSYGGFVGCIADASLVNANNIVVATVPPSANYKSNIANLRGGGSMNFTNLYCTYGNADTTNNWYFLGHSGAPTVNGVAIVLGDNASTANGFGRTFKDIVYVTPEKAASLIRVDANGYLNYVYDHIDAEAVQISAVSNGKYAVRFIAVSQLAEATNVNMVIIATYTDATGTHKIKFDSASTKNDRTPGCVLYDYLTVWGDKGIKESASAAQYSAEKLAGFTIYDIPTGNAITFEVTTSYVNAHGQTVTGVNTMTVNFDASGALVK